MARQDGRSSTTMRPVKLTRGYMSYAEGSCLIEVGNTKVICTATVEDRVPPHLRNTGTGWVTAEYAMLPRSCRQRVQRDSNRSGANGRSLEIQRLIGRALRAVVDTDNMGERTITIDCDVIQADGGTRTAAITGAWVALADAVDHLMRKNILKRTVIEDQVAATSVGVVSGADLLDLCYEEDSMAAVDMNVVMTGKGKLVEVQGTAEGLPFDRQRLNKLLDLAQQGVESLIALQKQVRADA